MFDSKLTAVGVRRLHPLLLRRQRHAVRPRRAVRQPVGGVAQAARCSSCSSWSSAARRRCCSTGGVLDRARPHRARAASRATQLPLVVAITTVAVDDRPHALVHRRGARRRRRRSRRSPVRCTACACAGLRRSDAPPGRLRPCIPTFRSRLEAPRGAPRGPRGRPAVPAEDLARLGHVGAGARRQPSRLSGWPSGAAARPGPGRAPDAPRSRSRRWSRSARWRRG